MRFDILTLFPDMVAGPLQTSILKRAQQAGLLEVHFHNIRGATTDAHKTVDDTPYGGGAGMVLKVDVLDAALQMVVEQSEVAAISPKKRRIILMTPQGRTFKQALAHDLASQYEQITLICGHYEGFDERIRPLVDEQVSIGEYVLTGGELPALVVVDAITRLLPEVLRQESPEEESHTLQDEQGNPLLEYPHYTRPLEYKGEKVPDILLSGNHAAIAAWRLEQAKVRTRKYREDHA
jgi:tRNA (guanine37-N1)-methyltransferase